MLATKLSILKSRKGREWKGDVGRDAFIPPCGLVYVTLITAVGSLPYILPYLFIISHKTSWSVSAKKASNSIL